jgi:hypothetical protein
MIIPSLIFKTKFKLDLFGLNVALKMRLGIRFDGFAIELFLDEDNE